MALWVARSTMEEFHRHARARNAVRRPNCDSTLLPTQQPHAVKLSPPPSRQSFTIWNATSWLIFKRINPENSPGCFCLLDSLNDEPSESVWSNMKECDHIMREAASRLCLTERAGRSGSVPRAEFPLMSLFFRLEADQHVEACCLVIHEGILLRHKTACCRSCNHGDSPASLNGAVASVNYFSFFFFLSSYVHSGQITKKTFTNIWVIFSFLLAMKLWELVLTERGVNTTITKERKRNLTRGVNASKTSVSLIIKHH